MPQDNNTESQQKAQLEAVRLNQPERLHYLHELLATARQPMLIEFCARGTRFTLGFIPTRQFVTTARPDTGGEEFTFIGLFTMGTMGGFYPFRLGGFISVGYVMEKLRMHNETDAEHIAALLNVLDPDHGDEYYNRHVKSRLAPERDYFRDPETEV